MSYDTDHAAFVRQQYRYVTVLDAEVKSNTRSAIEITVNTQMDQASATALAQAMLAENKAPRAFEIQLHGTGVIDSFAGSPPMTIPYSDTLFTDGRVCKTFSIVEDFQVGTTTIQVRG